jgi:hypothetical protein
LSHAACIASTSAGACGESSLSTIEEDRGDDGHSAGGV